jgi:phosphohistidine phosphatase
MKGELLLIRHGKAGSAEPNKNDFYRPLTEKGRAEFTTFLQTIQSQIATEGLEVWTSPLTKRKPDTSPF